MSAPSKSELVTILNHETSKMAWSELQRFFASGNAISVDSSLDLIDTAAEFALDNNEKMKSWIDAGLVGSVSDEQAQQWWNGEQMVWAVVIAPWVCVQPVKIEDNAGADA